MKIAEPVVGFIKIFTRPGAIPGENEVVDHKEKFTFHEENYWEWTSYNTGPTVSTVQLETRSKRNSKSKKKSQLRNYPHICTLFNNVSSAAPQIFHCVGGCWERTQDKRLRHWLLDALITRLDLIHCPQIYLKRL